jgi:hypothetical protein
MCRPCSYGKTVKENPVCFHCVRKENSAEKYMALLGTERDQWRCRFNEELYGLFKEPRFSVVIRIARLQWAGHVVRMDENCMTRRLMYVQPEGLRKVGRPHARWRDEVRNDARMLG